MEMNMQHFERENGPIPSTQEFQHDKKIAEPHA